MTKICTTCGLPEELCVCESIARESQKITAKVIKKKFGKKYTLIEGFGGSSINLKELTKALKERFACGGTSKGNYVELQGNHLKKLKKALIELDFSPDTIDIKG
ncbi:stress response translation initiation inhibitor YciH [Candidatus Woesearchaeota archaeon]|nr:stress response translation initiation inhibitor YciH [Candidatus Woesearchaeota archaeon]